VSVYATFTYVCGGCGRLAPNFATVEVTLTRRNLSDGDPKVGWWPDEIAVPDPPEGWVLFDEGNGDTFCRVCLDAGLTVRELRARGVLPL